MVILKSENNFLNLTGKKLLQVDIILNYPDELILSEEEVLLYADIKITEENGITRDLEADDFDSKEFFTNSNSFLFELIESRKKQFRNIGLNKEAKKILRILSKLNALKYLEQDKHYSVNDNEKLFYAQSNEEKVSNQILIEELTQKGIKIEHNFYYIDENKIALDMFGRPSSKSVNETNSMQLMSERVSQILKEKINFLKDIKVVLDENGSMNITHINGQKIDICINMNNIKDTNLKVGRINRINVAVARGSLVIKSSKFKKVDKCIFVERDRNIAKQALVLVPIGEYTRRYIVDTLKLKYFGFVKNCVIGFTDFENVESLY